MKHLYQNDYPCTPDLILGAIIGDTLGSPYEDFRKEGVDEPYTLLHKEARYTDDTVMTVAVMDWLLRCERYNVSTAEKWGESSLLLTDILREYYFKYPYAGYGGRIRKWLRGDKNINNSFGNGSAMRVSPVSWWARTSDEAFHLASISTTPTHNHPDGIEGATEVALMGYFARTMQGATPDAILDKTVKHNLSNGTKYNYNRTLSDIRTNGYHFDATCKGSVSESIICFLEGKDVIHSLENAVSLRGDTDTMAAIACGIAECYNEPEATPYEVRQYVWSKLPDEFKDVITKFTKEVQIRQEENDKLR